MVAISSLVVLSALTTSLAAPPDLVAREVEKRGPFNFALGPDHPLSRRFNESLARRSNTNYNQDYTTGGEVSFSPGTNEFSVTWNTQDDFVVGVGWNPGSSLPITHSGSFSVESGLGSLSVYGWTTNPLVEYYVMECNIGISTGGTEKGSVSSDGATYTIWENQRVNEPSIEGTSTFNQYISIRDSCTTSGTVTVENHFQAWASLGMDLGTMNFQVIAVESWDGSGTAQQAVSNSPVTTSTGGTTRTSSTTPTGPTSTSPSGPGQTEWGQCGGIGWTGPTTCQSPYTCQELNAYYSQCL